MKKRIIQFSIWFLLALASWIVSFTLFSLAVLTCIGFGMAMKKPYSFKIIEEVKLRKTPNININNKEDLLRSMFLNDPLLGHVWSIGFSSGTCSTALCYAQLPPSGDLRKRPTYKKLAL